MVKISKDDQNLIYQLGKDFARMENEIDKLKNKSIKALRILVPAIPEKYQNYSLKAVVDLPPEYQNSICIKFKKGQVELVETGKTLSVYAEINESEIYLAPIYKLQGEVVNVNFDQEQMAMIDKDIERKREREQREREQREQREQREREQQPLYKYLAKWLTDNYLEDVRAKAKNDNLKANGIDVYVNKNGLTDLLDKPFERNSYLHDAQLPESVYSEAKQALLSEKTRINLDNVDLSVAKDFNIPDYDYINDIL